MRENEMAPYRVERPKLKSVAEPSRDEEFRSYLDRLMKMIPSEILTLYLVGSGMIPDSESRWWLVIWSAVCLVGLIVLRGYGTADRRNGVGPQWASVVLSAVAFVIWVYSLGGPFAAFNLHKPFLGSLAIMAWTFFVPLWYKGD